MGFHSALAGIWNIFQPALLHSRAGYFSGFKRIATATMNQVDSKETETTGEADNIGTRGK
jgi:hypothetical protein